MSAAREPDQADFDLERFIDMFDEALTSKDPRVMETLRSLMMIVTLTRPESSNQSIDRDRGPLRRLFEDVNHLNNRLYRMEDEIRYLKDRDRTANEGYKKYDYPYEKYTLRAAAQMAQQVDQDVLNQLKQQAVAKINGGAIKGLYDK